MDGACVVGVSVDVEAVSVDVEAVSVDVEGVSAAGALGCSLTGAEGVLPDVIDVIDAGAARDCVLLSLSAISTAIGSSNTGHVKRVGWQTEQPASARSGNAARIFT